MPELYEKVEKLVENLSNKEVETEEIKVQKPKVKKVDINYKYNYENPEENKD